jgi:uncharacterized protein GlcG (DUF336 family)
MRKVRALTSLFVAAAMVLTSCSKGGPGANGANGSGNYTAPALVALTSANVEQIIAQAVFEAQARSAPSVIAVTDRVGNVLAVFNMTGAPTTVTVSPSSAGANNPADNHDLQGLSIVPAPAAAIAKAVTGAYLSSGGNAFSTRTASMIIQQEFPPNPSGQGQPSGPLFGVQFSQLSCSDLNVNYSKNQTIGPKPSPLGFSADPGGFPLYINGVVVGGIGVVSDGNYDYVPNDDIIDNDNEENVAFAGTYAFAAPDTITANMITVNGISLQYSNASSGTLESNPASAPGYGTLGGVGGLESVAGFYTAGSLPIDGEAYGSEASGIQAATNSQFSNPNAFVLTDGSGNDRYPIIGGTDGAEVTNPLTSSEVNTILLQAFAIMSKTRAQIRQPLNSQAQVTISVVDTRGVALGIVRAPDAPVFGIDVSLQKARTAAFFSDANAASDLTGNTDPNTLQSPPVNSPSRPYTNVDIRNNVTAFRSFLNDQTQLTGKTAFSTRAIGNLARPYFPDGEIGEPNGPLSRPIDEFNPFSTGLQSALIVSDVLEAVLGNIQPTCTYIKQYAAGANRLQNGLQIFAGAVPIYRGNALVGAIGVSGDGTSQDDMVAFLGLYNAGHATGTINEAPPGIRADQIVVDINGQQSRLLYVLCPVSPFLNSNEQDVCQGK